MLTVASLAALAAIDRPLVFASLQSELAEARGVPVRLVSIAFLAIVAVATAECAQIVGVLLVFTLHGRSGRGRVRTSPRASRRPSPFRRRSRSQKPGAD